MTSSATIGHIMSPLVDPQYNERDGFFDKVFNVAPAHGAASMVQHDCLKGTRRTSAEAIDWAGDKLLLASQKDCTMRLYDMALGEKERSWSGEWMAAECDPNNPFIASAVTWKGNFRIFDTRSSKGSVFDVDLAKSKISSSVMKDFLSLCWSPTSKHIALANRSDQVFLIDLRMSRQLRLGATHKDPIEITDICFGPGGDSLWLAQGVSPGNLRILPMPLLSAEGSLSMLAHQSHALCLARDPTGRYMASGGEDCLVGLWDPWHLCCVRTFGNATQPIGSVGFNHTGELLAWGTGVTAKAGEKNLPIVGSHTGTLFTMETTSAAVQHVKWHHSRNVLAYTVQGAQLPDDRDALGNPMRMREKDLALVHTLKISDSA